MVNDESVNELPTVCTAVPIIVRDIYLTALNGFFTFVSNVAYIVEGT